MSDNCPNCGAKQREYKFSLNRAVLNILIKMFNLYGSNVPVEIKTLGMTTSQWTNFAKLRYWGLIAKHEDENVPKGGIWIVTTKGKEFIENAIALSKTVVMYRNSFVRYEGSEVFEKQITDRSYKIRPEYVKDSQSVVGN